MVNEYDCDWKGMVINDSDVLTCKTKYDVIYCGIGKEKNTFSYKG